METSTCSTIKNKQRHRSSNFSNDENRILVDIVVKYKHIIENKKTDATSWKDKEKAWDEVAKQFNSRNLTPRTAKTLKLKYEGIKKSIRKKKAEERKEKFTTGGGPYREIIFTDFENSLLAEVDCKVEGLIPVGSDISNIVHDAGINDAKDCEQEKQHNILKEMPEIANNANEIYVLNLENSTTDVNLFNINQVAETNEMLTTEVEVVSDMGCALNTQNWSDTLKTTPSTKLRTLKRKKDANHANEKLELLTEAKLKLIKKEQEYLEKKEFQENDIYLKKLEYMMEQNKRMEDEHKLKMKILNLEYKDKHLKLLQADNLLE